MSSHENMEMDLFPEDQKKVARDIAEQAHLTLYSLSKIKGLGSQNRGEAAQTNGCRSV